MTKESSSMQLVASALASSGNEECFGGSKHIVGKVSMKQWHVICIASACVLMGVGVTSLSGYLVYKLYKLSRKLIDLEEQLRSLNIQLDLIDDFVDERGIMLEQQNNNSSTTNVNVNVSHKNQLEIGENVNSVTPNDFNNTNARPISILSRKKSVSFGSNLSLASLDYETPSTSPLDNGNGMISPGLKKSQRANEDNALIEKLNFGETHSGLTQIYNEKKSNQIHLSDNVLEMVDLARVAYFIGEKEKDYSLKKQFHMEAFALIQECLNLVTIMDNDDASLDYLVHKWFAMTAGRATDHVGFNEKLKLGFEFKDHLDLAIGLNDLDYLLFYLRGRWYHKMNSLSWIEKKGVKLLFNGEIPVVTIDDALRDFERVEELHPSKSKGNLLHLSKCLMDKQESGRCRCLLTAAARLPSRTPEHKLNDTEINTLLKSL